MLRTICEEIIALRLGMLGFRPMHLSFPTQPIPVRRHAALINRHKPKSIFEAWFDASAYDLNTYLI